MIKQTSFTAALPAAAALTASSKAISAKPGTVIGELTRLSAPVDLIGSDGKSILTTAAQQHDDDPDVSWFGHMVEVATSSDDLNTPTKHSLEYDGYVRDISKAVAQHVAHARNIVRPLVTEFAEGFATYAANARPREASEAAKITTLRLPALLKDASFLDTLTPYKDLPVLTPDKSLALNAVSKEELEGLVLIGHDRSDRLITEWLSHQPEYFLFNVWDCFFSKGASDAAPVYRFNAITALNNFAKADLSLAIMLIARKIASVVQESDMSLSAYQTAVAQYVDYAGSMLTDTLNKIAVGIRNKNLIVEKNESKLEVSVNGEVYPQWLEAGGSPEIILGALISSGSGMSQALIDEKRGEYLRQWSSYSTFYRTQELNNSFKYAKDYLDNAFTMSLQTLTLTEQEFVAGTPRFVEQVLERARKHIHDTLKPVDLNDPYAIALDLVAGQRFYYTSAKQILSDINDASKANLNVDVREAALLAVINYVSDFVADQITIS